MLGRLFCVKGRDLENLSFLLPSRGLSYVLLCDERRIFLSLDSCPEVKGTVDRGGCLALFFSSFMLS